MASSEEGLLQSLLKLTNIHGNTKKCDFVYGYIN